MSKIRTRKERTHYSVRLPHLAQSHVVSRNWFLLYLHLGFTELVGSKQSRPRSGLTAWINHDGGSPLQFANTDPSRGASIPSSWEWVERALALNLIGPNLSAIELERNRRAEYCVAG